MEVKLRDGRAVTLRDLRPDEDVFELTRWINELVDEDTYINVDERQTPESETEWLQAQLRSIEKGECIDLVAECGGRIAGKCEAKRGKYRERDRAMLGIAISREFRGAGLGEAMLRELIRRAREQFRPRMIALSYFEGNEPARKLYERIGFREVGRLPRWVMHGGREGAQVFMVLQ
jgi:RimJ/RimL family protein N-acetyltransferase